MTFGDGLGEIEFEGADGGKGFGDGLAVFLVGLVLFGGEGADLAGESVLVGVDAGACFPASVLGPVGPGRVSGYFRKGA